MNKNDTVKLVHANEIPADHEVSLDSGNTWTYRGYLSQPWFFEKQSNKRFVLIRERAQ